jgi:hypothetical protein
MTELQLNNITDGMKVVYRGSQYLAARRGATALVDLLQSTEDYICLIWDENRLRYAIDDNYTAKLLGQSDGGYHYHRFCPLESEEGQTILKEVGLFSETISQIEQYNLTYCSCNNPNIVKNYVMSKEFYYCRNCKKEASLKENKENGQFEF